MAGARAKRMKRIAELFPVVAELRKHGGDCDRAWWSRHDSREDPDIWLTLPISANNRGDDDLAVSNFETARKLIEAVSAFGTDYRCDAWPGGVIETLTIRADDAGAVREADRVISSLQDYPVLDEEDYSEREWESNHPSETECYAEEDCSCEFSNHLHVERIGPNDLDMCPWEAGVTAPIEEWTATCGLCNEEFEPFAPEYAEFWDAIRVLMGQTELFGL